MIRLHSMTRSMSKNTIALLLIFCSCQTSTLKMGEIDLTKWKSDRFACNGFRVTQFDKVKSAKEDLLRYGEREITLALGVPYKTELYEKSQKFYYYYLGPAAKCQNGMTESSVLSLRLRFNAMGYCNEAIILDH